MKESMGEDFELLDYNEAVHIEKTNLLSSNETKMEYDPNHWVGRQRQTWTVLLFFGCLLVYATRSSVGICVVDMSKELGWDKQVSGFVMSTFFFGYIITQIAGGILADRYGGDRMLFYSAFVWSICTFLIPVIGDVFHMPYTMGIIVLRALSGVAQGIHFPALASLLSRRVHPSHRNSVFAIAASGSAFGNVLNGVAGSLLLEFYGWRSVFYLLGGLSVLWVMVLRLANAKENVIDRKISNPSAGKQGKTSWRVFVQSKAFWALAFATGTESFVFTSLMSWSPTYFTEHFPDGKGWLFNVVPWVVSFVFQNAAGLFSDHALQKGWSSTKLRKLFVTLAGAVAGLICFRFATGVTTFESALLHMTLMIGCLGTNSVGLAMNPQDLAPEQAGSLFGFMNTIAALTGMIGVYFVGHILEATKAWSNIYFTISLVSFLGTFVFALFGSGKKIGS